MCYNECNNRNGVGAVEDTLHVGEIVEFRYAGTTMRGLVEKIEPLGVLIALKDYRAFKRSIRNRWHPPDHTRVGLKDILRIEKRA
ncbi:hypothetical protein C0431_12735 [bacterium]|nr:hypothetical protein [bacterium]